MTYVEGFIMPVPRVNRDRFIHFSDMADKLWTRHGADRILECWPDEESIIQRGDIFAAARGQDGEAMIFSWIEWRDKSVRSQNLPLLLAAMGADPRFDPAEHPLPFDNDRVISGCFRTIVDRGEPAPAPYVQGFVLPVTEDREHNFRALAEESWGQLRQDGALRLLVSWQDDFPENRQIGFPDMMNVRAGEKVAFALIEWPSRILCEAGRGDILDCRSSQALATFDQSRVISGGFDPVVLVG